MSDLPPSLRALYEACGPILRYRILRDVVGHDESYIETANMQADVAKLPNVHRLIAAQQENGLWGDFRTTEVAAHRLCEYGLESHRVIDDLRERILQPTLLKDDLIWEFEQAGLDDEGKRLARRVVRDKTLHLLCRTQREDDPLARTFLEHVLAEWELCLTGTGAARKAHPTADGYAAVCRYPWDEDEFPRIESLVKRLIDHVEAQSPPERIPNLLMPYLLRVDDKWQYLAQPPRLLYELELAATLGMARDLDFGAWMLEELEARQDADGFFRFPEAGQIQSYWYFPVESDDPDEFYLEYTFRAELIFKRLEYDL